MAAEPLFIDAGGFYALVSPDSESYKLAVGIMREAARQRRRALRPTTSLMKPPRCFARAASPSCWLNSFRERKLLIQMFEHELAGGGKAVGCDPLSRQRVRFFGEAIA